MKQAAQKDEIQAIIVSEEQDLAALKTKKAKRAKLVRRGQEQMDTLQRLAAKREEQHAIISRMGGQAVIEATVAIEPEPTRAISLPPTATIRLEEDCHALATSFSIVSEVIANGENTVAPTSVVKSVEYHPKTGKCFMIRTRTEPYYILTIEN